MITFLSLYKVPTLPYGMYTVRKKIGGSTAQCLEHVILKEIDQVCSKFFYLIE